MDPSSSRTSYPSLGKNLKESDLKSLFAVDQSEQLWASSVARHGTSMVVLLAHLKVFQHLCRFLPVAEIPRAALEPIGRSLAITVPETFEYDHRTLYRHHRAVREYLGITPWGPKARAIATQAIAVAAETRLDPADLINAAIDALLREGCELPALATLRTLSGTAHRVVNSSQWNQIYERLSHDDRLRLDELLANREGAAESAFAVLCRGPGKPTRANVRTPVAHYQWLTTLIDPVAPLVLISEAKVSQWANEAKRLKARELREYVAPRRYALLLAVLREAKGRVLDDLTVMLLKLSRRVVWKSTAILEEWHAERSDQTEILIRTLADTLAVMARDKPPSEKVGELKAIMASRGNLEYLQQACAAYLGHSYGNWQPFACEPFAPYRAEFLLLARTLPLNAARASARDLLEAVHSVADEPDNADYLLMDLSHEFLPSRWRALIADHDEGDPRGV